MYNADVLLKALGSYWEDYFEDRELLVTLTDGALSLVSQEYGKLINMAMSSSLITLPVEKPLSYDLLLIPENSLTLVEPGHYTFEYRGIKDIEYFSNALFDPELTLEKGVHFNIEGSRIHFYVDLFDDENINRFLYRSDDIHQRHVVLWATNLVLSDEWIYNKYGTFLYNQEPDSDDYKAIVTAILYFYVNTKSISRIESVINILFGAPFSRIPGEVVQKISEITDAESPTTLPGVENYHRIDTDYSVYYCPKFFNLNVEEGEVLSDYKVFGRINSVSDYVSDPTWYHDATIPASLFKDITAMDGFEDEYRRQHVYYSGQGSHGGRAIHQNISFKEWVDSFDEKPPAVHHLTPDKFEANPNHPEDNYRYDGSFTYNSHIKHFTLRSFYKYVYDLVDQVLKHNLLYFRNKIPIQNYAFMTAQKHMFMDTIRSGIPVYLQPIIEFIAFSEEEDTLKTMEDSSLHTRLTSRTKDYYSDTGFDTNTYQGIKFHDGSISYNNSPFYDRDTMEMLISTIYSDRQTTDDGDLNITILDAHGTVLSHMPEQDLGSFFRKHTGWDHSGSINYYGGKSCENYVYNTVTYSDQINHHGKIVHSNDLFCGRVVLHDELGSDAFPELQDEFGNVQVLSRLSDKHSVNDGPLDIQVINAEGVLIDYSLESPHDEYFRTYSGWTHTGELNYFGGRDGGTLTYNGRANYQSLFTYYNKTTNQYLYHDGKISYLGTYNHQFLVEKT